MAMRRPRIKRTTESFRAPDGDYYLRRPSANRDVRIEQEALLTAGGQSAVGQGSAAIPARPIGRPA